MISSKKGINLLISMVLINCCSTQASQSDNKTLLERLEPFTQELLEYSVFSISFRKVSAIFEDMIATAQNYKENPQESFFALQVLTDYQQKCADAQQYQNLLIRQELYTLYAIILSFKLQTLKNKIKIKTDHKPTTQSFWLQSYRLYYEHSKEMHIVAQKIYSEILGYISILNFNGRTKHPILAIATINNELDKVELLFKNFITSPQKIELNNELTQALNTIYNTIQQIPEVIIETERQEQRRYLQVIKNQLSALEKSLFQQINGEIIQQRPREEIETHQQKQQHKLQTIYKALQDLDTLLVEQWPCYNLNCNPLTILD